MDPTHATPSRLRRIEVAALLAGMLCASVLLAGSEEIQRLHNSDSLLHSQVSRLAWTPFYWGQDRLGMLYPLLASPVRDPLWNVILLSTLHAFASLGGLVLLGVYVLGPRRGAWAGVACGLLLVGTQAYAAFELFVHHPEYLAALGPLMAGVVLLDRAPGGGLRGAARVGGGAVLVAMGTWVNVALPVMVGMLVVARRLLRRPGQDDAPRGDSPPPAGRGTLRTLAVLGVSMAGVKGLSLSLDLPRTEWGLVPPAQWPVAWWRLARGAVQMPMQAWLWICLGIAVAGALVAAVRSARFRRIWRPAGALLIAATGMFLLTGTLEHVAAEGYGEYGQRYIYLPQVFALAAVLVAAAGLPGPPLRGRAGVSVTLVAAGLLALGPLVRYGVPGERRILANWEQRWGERARAVIAHDCTHVSGHYWHTWDTVFYANLLHRRAGRDRTVYGITDRSCAAFRCWRAMPVDAIRVAVIPESYDIEYDMYGLRGTPLPQIDPDPVADAGVIRIHRCLGRSARARENPNRR